MEKETLFTKIASGAIPSVKLYEDDICFVILDINPVNKGHALVIAKKPYTNAIECPDDVLAHMFSIAKKVDAKQREVLKSDGSNMMINNDPASGQEVPHIHIHVTPRFFNDGKSLAMDHAKYDDGEMQKLGALLKL